MGGGALVFDFSWCGDTASDEYVKEPFAVAGWAFHFGRIGAGSWRFPRPSFERISSS